MKILYGRKWPDETTQLQAELTMYRHTLGEERLKHCKRAYAMLYPQLVATYNSWTEKILRELCTESRKKGGIASILGASGSGKSLTVGYWAVLDFLAAPDDTVLLLASDTVKNIEKRVWKYVRQAYKNLPFKVGRLLNSKPESIVADNQEGGLYIVALENDPQSEKLKGFHPKRLRIIIDEGTAINKTCLNHWENWTAADKEFILVVMSNFRGLDNLAAAVSEPIHGFNSIDYTLVETWKSKVGGSVLLLDAMRSPVYKKPHLKEKLPFLKTKEEVDLIIDGTDELPGLGENHPRVMQYIRSIPTWDQSEKTILNRKLISKGGADQKAKWAGWGRIPLLALDPALVTDGDECILQEGLMGYDNEGYQILEYTNTVSIPINSRLTQPTEYQILEYLVKYCTERNIPPDNVIMDAAGQGRGLGSIIHHEWSSKVLLLNPGQAPTDKIVDYDTRKTAKDVYDRLVTELWFDVQLYVETAQLRNIPPKAQNEFCTRTYDDSTKRIRLETKKEYKLRITGDDSVDGSPDTGDACTYLLRLAQEFGFHLADRKRTYADITIRSMESAEERFMKRWVQERDVEPSTGGQNFDPMDYSYGGKVVD